MATYTPAEIQPAQVPQLRCPRCWAARPFIPVAALTFRCAGCEWQFTLAAPSIAAPAFPATTVTVTNPYATVLAATITLNGATVTGFYVNTVSAGTTAGTYLIPVGGVFSATFTGGPPTWTWQLPVTNAATTAGGAALPFAAGGAYFTQGQVLIVDPSGTSDVVVVNGTPTATSVPVTALNASHGSGVSVTVAVLAPALSGVEAVPQTAY